MHRDEFPVEGKAVYCAVNNRNQIVRMLPPNGAIYFEAPRYLKNQIEAWNNRYPDDQLHVVRFALVEVDEGE